jgi:hypothetical protein
MRTYRSAPSAYVVLVGLVSVPALIWIYGLLNGITFDVGFGLAVLALPVSFWGWLAAFRLDISDDTIAYRSLFGGVRNAKVSDIESISPSRAPRPSRSPLQFRVQLRDKTGFIVNMKPFPKAAASMLLSVQRPNRPMRATCEDAPA